MAVVDEGLDWKARFLVASSNGYAGKDKSNLEDIILATSTKILLRKDFSPTPWTVDYGAALERS